MNPPPPPPPSSSSSWYILCLKTSNFSRLFLDSTILFLRQLWILWPIYIYISHQQSIFFSIKHSVFSHRNQHLEKRTANIQPVFSLRHQTIPWVPRSLGGFHIRRSIALVKTVECVWNDKKVWSSALYSLPQGIVLFLLHLLTKSNHSSSVAPSERRIGEPGKTLVRPRSSKGLCRITLFAYSTAGKSRDTSFAEEMQTAVMWADNQ